MAAVAPRDGYIYWISDSYQGSKTDNEMLEFSENHFWKKMTTEEYICGDKGFKGLDRHHKNVCLPFFSEEKENEENFNNQLAHYRIIVENLFAAIKKWKICSKCTQY